MAMYSQSPEAEPSYSGTVSRRGEVSPVPTHLDFVEQICVEGVVPLPCPLECARKQTGQWDDLEMAHRQAVPSRARVVKPLLWLQLGQLDAPLGSILQGQSHPLGGPSWAPSSSPLATAEASRRKLCHTQSEEGEELQAPRHPQELGPVKRGMAGGCWPLECVPLCVPGLCVR